jgi:hypothetical protein
MGQRKGSRGVHIPCTREDRLEGIPQGITHTRQRNARDRTSEPLTASRRPPHGAYVHPGPPDCQQSECPRLSQQHENAMSQRCKIHTRTSPEGKYEMTNTRELEDQTDSHSVALTQVIGCEVCTNTAAHGWWGRSLEAGFTHCRDCHVSYPGSQVSGHCRGCCNTFRGVRTFDAHKEAGKCPPGAVETWNYRGTVYIVL